MTETILRGVSLSKHFGGLRAVDDVSFDIAAGGITAVIGPNGAGKTTLFNLISGTFRPTAGHLFFRDQDVTGKPAHQMARLGLIRTFQLVHLFGDMTVRENVLVGRHSRTRGGIWSSIVRPPAYRQQEQDSIARANEYLHLLGLGGHADAPAASLAAGQRRLLEIARALAAEPAVLLLDEPAAGLNPAETRELAAVLRTLIERLITIVLVEHDMNFVMGLADHVVVLDFGRKIAEGTSAEVRAHPAVIEAYLGSPRTAQRTSAHV
jgi:branched-chain amino acid transport system ATP-binding protein